VREGNRRRADRLNVTVRERRCEEALFLRHDHKDSGSGFVWHPAVRARRSKLGRAAVRQEASDWVLGQQAPTLSRTTSISCVTISHIIVIIVDHRKHMRSIASKDNRFVSALGSIIGMVMFVVRG